MRKLHVIQPRENIEGCTCNTEEIEEHTCPYSEEINEDYDSFCTCCSVCYRECLDAI